MKQESGPARPQYLTFSSSLMAASKARSPRALLSWPSRPWCSASLRWMTARLSAASSRARIAWNEANAVC
jgi:hypothetical protein